MERYAMKHINGWERFRVRVIRLEICLACLICCALLVVPSSYADTIWLRNGTSYSDVTVIEETETELVLELRGGTTRTVPLSAVSGRIVDTKAKNTIDPGARSTVLRSETGSVSHLSTRSTRRSVHAFRSADGTPILTNNPGKYDSQYEEILAQLEPIVRYRPGDRQSDELLRRALARDAYVAGRRRGRPAWSPDDAHDSYIIYFAGVYGVRPELVKAVIKAESNFEEKAVSSKGAQGLMQLMPRTAEAMGINDPFDPEENIAGGTQYLSRLLKMFGNERLAVAAYNAGPGRVKRYGGVPPYRETRDYVARVFRHAERYAGRFSS